MTSVQPTNNPVPSDHPADARDNLKRIDEVVNLQSSKSSPTRTGKSLDTFFGISALASEQRDGIEDLAEEQREQFDETFTSQFAYKFIGNISEYVGDTLSESEKLNAYQYPDNSNQWFGPIQSQAFPITIPSDPSVDDGWALVSPITLFGLSASDVNSGRTTNPRTTGDSVRVASEGKDYICDPSDSDSPDDGGKTTIITKNGLRAKTNVSDLRAIESGDGVDFRYGRNHILNYVSNRPEPSGSTSSNGTGVVPHIVSGDGHIDYTIPSGNYTYSEDAALYISGQVETSGDVRVRMSSQSTPIQNALEIAFNYNHVTSTAEAGTISYSVFGETGVLYTNTYEFDIGIIIDTKPTGKAFYFLERQTNPLNKWVEISPRINGLSVAPQGKASIIVNNGGGITLDHCELDACNYISIGDSLCAGANLFDPSPSAGRDDFSHQWQQNCVFGGVNNFIWNRGVGGNSSEQINSRIQADVIDNNPKLCFLHLSTNDERLGVTYQERQSITQDSINKLNSAGIDVVLLNSVYPNNDQAAADYYRDWLYGESFAFRGLSDYRMFIDQMIVLRGADGNLNPTYTATDGIHLNQDGYDLFGSYIKTKVGQNPGGLIDQSLNSNVVNFQSGIMSKGEEVSTSKRAKYELSPISGSRYYSVTKNSGDDILITAYREEANDWVIHLVTSYQGLPSVISVRTSTAPLTSALGHIRGVSQIASNPDENTYDGAYSTVMMIDNGVPDLRRPSESEMNTLGWTIIF